jgi:hypothetical protein
VLPESSGRFLLDSCKQMFKRNLCSFLYSLVSLVLNLTMLSEIQSIDFDPCFPLSMQRTGVCQQDLLDAYRSQLSKRGL